MRLYLLSINLKQKSMETVCIEVKAWKMLKQRLELLTNEVEMMRNHCAYNARDK